MAKRMISPEEYAQRWVSGMNRAETQAKYKASIQNLDFNPLDRAADAGDAYISGCQQGNAKRARNLRAYGQQQWVSQCVNKGASRLGSGATASQGRMKVAGSRLLPMISQVLGQLPQGGSAAARRERMLAFSDMMKTAAAAG